MKFKMISEIEEGPMVFWKAYISGSGDLLLEARSNKDNRVMANVLSISTNGTLRRYRSINPVIGLSLDENGRIQEATV